jgi:hypothetical protein
VGLVTTLQPSRDQETRRGGGVFTFDGKPAHWLDGRGSGICARCRTPWDGRTLTPCFYPMTLAEAAEEVAVALETVCVTTVSLSTREACGLARLVRAVQGYDPTGRRGSLMPPAAPASEWECPTCERSYVRSVLLCPYCRRTL